MRPKDCAYIVEHLSVRFMAMVADHSRQLAEHRAAFGARTEADAKIIAGLREESAKYKAESDHFYQREGIEQKRRIDSESERDGLLTQVQDMREEIIRVNDAHGRTIVERDALRANVKDLRMLCDQWKQRETELLAEVERLNKPARQHPVKPGERLRKTTDGLMYKAGECFRLTGYEMINGEIWCNLENGASWLMSVCEPCDPPTEATHDTPEGRSVAESVIRDDRKTEPKPENTVRLVRVPTPDPELDGLVTWPWQAEWGKVGEVAEILKTLNASGLPAIAVRLASGLVVWWPLSCVEVVKGGDK